MSRKCLVWLLVAALAIPVFAAELTRLDFKMVCYDRVLSRASILPNGINGQFLSTFENLRDSCGFLVYDKWYRIFESYRMPEVAGEYVSLDSITFVEYACRLTLISPQQSGFAQVTWAAKRNQASWAIGPEEARTIPTDDLRRFWPIASTAVELRSFGITDVVRPYSLNTALVQQFHNVPDAVSQFEYLTVSYSVNPSLASPSDTLLVDMTSFPANCSRVLWTTADATVDDYPLPGITPLQPGEFSTYAFDAAQLGLPPGYYELSARRFDQSPMGIDLNADIQTTPDGWWVDLPEDDRGRGSNSLVVSQGGQVVRVVGFDPGDRAGWSMNLVEIPQEGDDR